MLQNLLVLVATFLALSIADNMPEKCKSPPMKVNHGECCKFPPVLDENAMDKCGFAMLGSGPPTHGSHSGPPPCDKELCLFKELKIMSDDKNVDTTATVQLIKDSMLGQGAEWAAVADDVAKNCLKDLTEGPPGLCQPVKLMVCIRDTMFQKCPAGKWVDSADCNELKQFRSECPHPHGPPMN